MMPINLVLSKRARVKCSKIYVYFNYVFLRTVRHKVYGHSHSKIVKTHLLVSTVGSTALYRARIDVQPLRREGLKT